MRAELKRLHSPDVENLESYVPKPSDDFGFLLQVMVGPKNEPGEESFAVLVCTPDRLKRRHKSSDVVVGRHYLVVFEYDYGRLRRFFQEYCEQCFGVTWSELANKLGRIGKWEFEDYEAAPG
jgi:hypothetical protein